MNEVVMLRESDSKKETKIQTINDRTKIHTIDMKKQDKRIKELEKIVEKLKMPSITGN